MNIREKIEWIRGWAPTQPDIRACSRILDVCDVAQKAWEEAEADCEIAEPTPIETWNAPESAPKDGTTIDVYFPVKGKNTPSRTRWMTDEGRWNGMAKGEDIYGWINLPAPPANDTEASNA